MQAAILWVIILSMGQVSSILIQLQIHGDRLTSSQNRICSFAAPDDKGMYSMTAPWERGWTLL
jgi:hypothetical protein